MIPAAFLILLLALAAPVLLVPLPPLLDYPNHLMRLWLLAGGVREPPLSSIYAVEWTALTNIGIDLLVLPLSRMLAPETIGTFYLVLGILLPPLGAALLHRAVHGRLHWWVLAFPILAWNGAILAGFLNFQIALGVALLAAAADPTLARRGMVPAFLARSAFAAALMLLHLFGLVFYAALLCGLALGPDLGALRGRAALRQAAGRLVAAMLPVALVFAGFLLTAPALPGAHAATNAASLLADFAEGFGEVLGRYKAKSALAWIWSYDLRLDLCILALALAPLGLALARGRVRVHGGLLLVALGLGLLFLLVPFRLAGTYWVDRRFVLMAAFALPAALQPELPRLALRRAAAALLVLLGLGRSAFVAEVWRLRQADVAAVERVLALVPPGAAILPLEHLPPSHAGAPIGRYFSGGAESFGHYPTLALRERHAFVPTLFTARGKQPLRVLPPWDTIAVPEGGPVTVHALSDPAVQRSFLWVAPYLPAWRERYDYVLVVNADMPDVNGPFVPPEGLRLVADEGFAQLYRLRRDGPAATVAR